MHMKWPFLLGRRTCHLGEIQTVRRGRDQYPQFTVLDNANSTLSWSFTAHTLGEIQATEGMNNQQIWHAPSIVGSIFLVERSFQRDTKGWEGIKSRIECCRRRNASLLPEEQTSRLLSSSLCHACTKHNECYFVSITCMDRDPNGLWNNTFNCSWRNNDYK